MQTYQLVVNCSPMTNDTSNIQIVQAYGNVMTFDRQIKIHNGWVAGVDIIPIYHDIGANTNETKKKTKNQKLQRHMFTSRK